MGDFSTKIGKNETNLMKFLEIINKNGVKLVQFTEKQNLKY